MFDNLSSDVKADPDIPGVTDAVEKVSTSTFASITYPDVITCDLSTAATFVGYAVISSVISPTTQDTMLDPVLGFAINWNLLSISEPGCLYMLPS
jgi:hypothetical protein